MTGIQFGFNPLLQTGFSNPTAVTPSANVGQSVATQHVVNNPTSSQVQPSNSFTLGYLPAYFVAYAPVAVGFPLANPGFGGFAGQASAGGVADAAAGHVTQNPTSSVNSSGAPNSAAFGAGGFGGFAGVGFAQPIILSPVLFQFGIPVYFQNPPTLPAPAPVPQNPVVDDVEPPVIDEPPPVVTDAPAVVDDASDDDILPTLPIKRLAVDDFAKLRYRAADRSLETELILELTTQDGDKVSLDFRQLDVKSHTRLAGHLNEGGHVKFSERLSSTERYVTINVEGDLSAEEKAAIDSLIDEVIGVANKFFKGNFTAAMERLESFEFNTEELADFSLKLSLTASLNVDKVFLGTGGQLESLALKDSEVSSFLEFFADEQTQLIESAKQELGDASAAKLVRTLLPKLVATPLEQLLKAVEKSESFDQLPVEPEPTEG